MLAITLILLVLGGLLAAFGTAGFTLVYHQPASAHELERARKAATVGRWLTIPGLCLYAAHYGASGPGLYALLIVAMLIPAMLIIKSKQPAATGVAR